ncbi:IS481 family transposase [Dietzia massiliensis]|uniref:IS481 family transposase n=1 Tax=Dietzia massiliensis TaxID=2697499 RepID=UPI001BCC2B97|nr:IS481 family transposase [Dietzia massiliensis]MBS7548315.1 IS481 family transposase [Dietzia massiliensis]
MSHANAPLTPTGRLRLARCVVEDGWTRLRAAERFNVSVSTVRKWVNRYREYGKAGMVDRSSRPHHSPPQTPRRRERRVLGLRVSRRWGPARIAYHLGMQPSTVHKILSRYGCVRLAFTDPATGAPVRAHTRRPRRYEHEAPGDLVHVDIKKLGRMPDGGGHKVHGRAKGKRDRKRGMGYWYIHNAVDDHSRLAYTELLEDERKETAAGFCKRAHAYFADAGITVHRVLTDNGSCYRSHAFADALGPEIKHKRTRPYRPQTNGKVERYNRTMLEEWAYAAAYVSESDRAARLPAFLYHYNFHRGHTALRGASPADRVHNLRGQYS